MSAPEHLLLDRVAELLQIGDDAASFRGGDGSEMLALARLACDVPDEIDDAPVFAAMRRLLDTYARLSAADPRTARRARC